MEKLFQKVDTVFVPVDKIESTLEWYQKCLGLELIWQNDYVSILSTEGETPITLLHKHSSSDEFPIFNLLTHDIEKAHAHLQKYGGEPEPIIEEQELKTFDFKDPEGNRLNVCFLKTDQKK